MKERSAIQETSDHMTKAKRLTFFSRFNKIIVLTYGVVIFCACLLFSLLFKENHASRLNYLQLRLQEQSQAYNYMIRLRADAVHTLHTQAQDYLDMTFLDTPVLPHALQESADQSYYHMDAAPNKDLVGNLVGQGSLSNLTIDQKREIEMAFSLNPVFRAIKKNLSSVSSLYYVSKSGFENYFPWKPSKKFKWTQSNLKSHFLADLSVFHLPSGTLLSWSDIYIKEEETSLRITCTAPIHRKEKLLGAIAINFTLNSINEFVSGITNPYGHLLIINNYETVIADSHVKKAKHSTIVKASQILPSDLNLTELHKLPRKELTRLGKYWVFHVKSPYAPWSFIYYVPASKFLFATFEEIGPSVLFLIIFAVVILRAANSLIAQEFIRPAHKLVYLIANRAHGGEKEYKDMPEPWIPWFEEVRKVFQENQVLVERLETNIKELDSEVNKRTQELSNKNKALVKAMDGLKKAQNQIIVQEKLAGLGALTAGIAHEIKNPLTYIINFAELSREYMVELSSFITTDIRDKQNPVTEIFYNLTHNMQRIEDHGKRADAIIRTMLMHARGKTEQLEDVDLNQLIEENSLLAISGMRQQGLLPRLVKKFDARLPHLKVYPQELGRVILNLINNACYALYQKKTSTLEPFEPQICLETFYDEKNIIIKILDNGPGIPEKISKNIFDPFFTTKPAGSGTGLGLSLSYEIIAQQHHGTLTMHSKIGEYTEFIITLPIESE